MQKVLAFGTFDILHPGHEHMLKEARGYGDHLTVIVARDATVEKVKQKKPVFDENIRLKNLENLHIADKVRLGNLGDKHQVIREEEPDIIALGYDQKFFIENIETVAKKHVKIVRLAPYKPEIYKSSKIKENLESYAKDSDSH